MLNGADIIMVGLQPWDIAIGSNSRNIAIELSKRNRVLYVNPPLDRSTFYRYRNKPEVQKRHDILDGRENSLVKISESLYTLYPDMLAESVNWIPLDSAFRHFNRINNKRLAQCIRGAVQQLQFKNYILFNDQSMIRCFYLKELLRPSGFIYYIRDNLTAVPYFQKHGLKLQEELIAQADVVAANSGYLAEYAKKYNPNSAMVGQGCDFSLYKDPDEINIPGELIAIREKGPVIGYTGYLTSMRLDIMLLETIANARKDWQFVFVGHEDEQFSKSKLHKMENVTFAGNQHPDSLPGYIKGFNVAINPQLVNEVTAGNYPRKIDEYLAMGVPVVATSTPFMSYFREHTYLGSTADEYIYLIEAALREDSPERQEARRLFAMHHTWENNVNAIEELYIKSKNNRLN